MTQRPPQSQAPPGHEAEMEPSPADEMRGYTASGKLEGRRALVTGGDSGIGRAVAIAFAKEGADVAIAYLSEDDDAGRTVELLEAAGARAISLRSDLGGSESCRQVVDDAARAMGGLDVLVANHATHDAVDSPEEISDEQWQRTLATNVSSYFWLVRASLDHLGEGAAIITTGSVNGFRGNPRLIDYAASKGAVHALTQSLSKSLRGRGIRVNCVAPGPVWTPLIASTFEPDEVADFGEQAPVGRAADPDEIAPSFVFLASAELSSYYTGAVLAPLGGETLPGA